MDHQRRSPSINLITSSSPARPVSTTPSPHTQSTSPFRYVQFSSSENVQNQSTLLANLGTERQRSVSPRRTSFRPDFTQPAPPPPQRSPRYSYPSPLIVRPPVPRPMSCPPRSFRICNALRPWLPVILYGLTTLGFIVAFGLYKTEVFALLDELSRWLKRDEDFGHAILFLLIFITTIPPFPLYSTLIILSGYTFGAWTGAVISYLAGLTGALAVFCVSRSLFRDTISRWLGCSPGMKRVVRAVEKRPKLLFLIRLAPYPYNVMNCLLAAAPTLSLRTYTVCTALSLFKVIIHTSMGASIHSFKDYHVIPDGDKKENDDAGFIAHIWTITGIALCLAILIYLAIVARRAVDEELDGENLETPDERIAFLSSDDLETGLSGAGPPMTELRSQPLSAQHP